MKRLLLLVLSFATINGFGQNLKTVFEQSEGRKTGTYDEVISYYEKLAASSEYIAIKTVGMTDSGYPLHLVTLDLDNDFDFEKSYKKGKTIVLINNGIHPGEADGIEASMMLLRDYATQADKKAMLENTVIAVIPIYNIGGALNRNSFSRPNQDGPEEYGFRGNARNYDLNRDFIKADTRNTKAFYEIFHEVNPDIFVDTHVSNGADYQYTITHLITQHNKMGGAMGKYLEDTFRPRLEKLMVDKGAEITPYVNVFNTTPDESGFPQFLDNPRYSTGYSTLFGTLGFMIETHMLKPFDVRVNSTYNLLQATIQIAKEDGKKIRSLKLERQADFKAGTKHPVDWRLTRSESSELNFKGYVGEKVTSKVTGQERLLYGHNRPFTKIIPYYNTYVSTEEVTIPKAYVVPQGWYYVIELLKLNNAQFKRLKQDSSISVEVYHIDKFNTSKSAYEGHYPNNNTKVITSIETLSFRKGDYIFTTDQPAARYLIETLEPTAPDSFFSWNYFDTILQQKEGFSPYVFEDNAQQLLEAEPELRKEFNKKKNEELDFAQNWYAQLDFIFKRSPYYEEAHMRYPIFRIVE
ncbi:MAG: M14 family metallopeptidase [Fulvivirga sp.]